MAYENLSIIFQALSSFVSIILLFFAAAVFKMRKEEKLRKGLQYIIVSLFIQSARSLYMAFGGPLAGVEWGPKFFESVTLIFALLGASSIYSYYRAKEKIPAKKLR
jgi:hypothetical protein